MDYDITENIEVISIHNSSLVMNDLSTYLHTKNFNNVETHNTNFVNPLKYTTGYIYYNDTCFDIGVGICDFDNIDNLNFFVDKNQENGKKFLNYINSLENKIDALKNNFMTEYSDTYKLSSIINKPNLNNINILIQNIIKNNCDNVMDIMKNKHKIYGFNKKINTDTLISDIINMKIISTNEIFDNVKLYLKKKYYYYYKNKLIYKKNKSIIDDNIKKIIINNLDLNEEEINEKINKLIFKLEFYDNLNKKINIEIVKMKDIIIKKKNDTKIYYRKIEKQNMYTNTNLNDLNDDMIKKICGNPKEIKLKKFYEFKKYFKSNTYMKIQIEFDEIEIDKYNHNNDLFFKLKPKIKYIDIIEFNDENSINLTNILHSEYKKIINQQIIDYKKVNDNINGLLSHTFCKNYDYHDDIYDIDYLFQNTSTNDKKNTNDRDIYDLEYDSNFVSDVDSDVDIDINMNNSIDLHNFDIVKYN